MHHLRRRLIRAALAVPVPALLHFHIHHHFHGPPFDYATLAVAAAASWIGLPGPGEPILIAAGILAARHKLDIGSVLIVAFLAAAGGRHRRMADRPCGRSRGADRARAAVVGPAVGRAARG